MLVQDKLNRSQQRALAVAKANRINKPIASKSREMIVPLCLAHVRLPLDLEYCVQSQYTHYKAERANQTV